MPIYEYRCGECGEDFDVMSTYAERESRAVCPACGSRVVTRRFGGFTQGGSRTSVNPGTFVKEKGRPVRHEKPPPR